MRSTLIVTTFAISPPAAPAGLDEKRAGRIPGGRSSLRGV